MSNNVFNIIGIYGIVIPQTDISTEMAVRIGVIFYSLYSQILKKRISPSPLDKCGRYCIYDGYHD